MTKSRPSFVSQTFVSTAFVALSACSGVSGDALESEGAVEPEAISADQNSETLVASTEQSLFQGVTPAVQADGDTQSVELGLKFRASSTGRVTGVRFFKGPGNAGTHTGHLWNRDGKLLAALTFTNESASGWQTGRFSSPISIAANTTYVVSYLAPQGHYAGDAGGLKTARSVGNLTALANGQDGPNSVYRYGASAFPTSTYSATNYYVDVLFVPTLTVADAGTPPPPPPPPPPAPDSGTSAPSGCLLSGNDEACWKAHTGVPGWSEAQIVAGQSPLKHVVGDVTITQDGAVLHDQWIDGCIAVRASNVILYNVLVRSNHPCYGGKSNGVGAVISTGANGGGGIKNLVVRDSEIDGMNAPGDTMGIGQTEYTCLRCNIHGTEKGSKADQNVTLQDSYLHDLANDHATHSECFFYDGGAGTILVRHNWMKANADFSTGALSLNNDWEGHNAVIDSNYLEGVGGADFTGGAMGKPTRPMWNIWVVNNALSPNNGYGGTQFAYGFDPAAPGNVWLNNYNSVTKAAIAAPRPL